MKKRKHEEKKNHLEKLLVEQKQRSKKDFKNAENNSGRTRKGLKKFNSVFLKKYEKWRLKKQIKNLEEVERRQLEDKKE